MKLTKHAISTLSLALLATVLAGCAGAPAGSQAHAHANMGGMDPQAMCEMHKRMMSGQPSAEQQAMMQEHMKAMTPEMHQRMHAMHERCQ
jgi:hypothetical protein